jgi:hypothetical protein
MVLGGLFRIDLLECIPHRSNKGPNHVRITTFTNLPSHITSTEKAIEIFNKEPSEFIKTCSSIEICSSRALGPELRLGLELDLKSTGDSERNTVEIVFAGLGFVAIGGNFVQAKLQVWTPQGRGIGIRQPIVQEIEGGQSLRVLKRKPIARLVPIKKKHRLAMAAMAETELAQPEPRAQSQVA